MAEIACPESLFPAYQSIARTPISLYNTRMTYYTRLLYLWEDKENGIVYAIMSRWKRWYLVERRLHKKLRLEDLYKLPNKKD